MLRTRRHGREAHESFYTRLFAVMKKSLFYAVEEHPSTDSVWRRVREDKSTANSRTKSTVSRHKSRDTAPRGAYISNSWRQNNQDYEVVVRNNKQNLNISGGVHEGKEGGPWG